MLFWGAVVCSRSPFLYRDEKINFFPFTLLQPDLEYAIIYGVRAREVLPDNKDKDKKGTTR